MNLPMKLGIAGFATFSLNGCFLSPNNFDATIILTKDGGYEFSYVGDMRYLVGDERINPKPPKKQMFDARKAVCSTYIDQDGKKRDTKFYHPNLDIDSGQHKTAAEAKAAITPVQIEPAAKIELFPRRVSRECTKEELAKLEKEEDARFRRKQAGYEDTAAILKAVFGTATPGDDEGLKAFAAKIKEYDGWQSVKYLGESKFKVSFRSKGKFDHYFVFPVIPQASAQFPFFHILKHANGDIEMESPAVKFAISKPIEERFSKGPNISSNFADIEDLKGKVTIMTDGTVVANNAVNGITEENGMKVLRWSVDGIKDAPRATISFTR